MNETTSLWNKPVNELTVADSVKLNLAALGIVVGAIAGLAAVGTVADKIRLRRANRQNKSTEVTE